MKQALSRFLAYSFAIVLWFITFAKGPTIFPTDTPTVKAAAYLGYYGFSYVVWILICECVYRLLRWNANRQRDNADSPTGNPKHLFPNSQKGQHTQSLKCWCHPEQVDGFVFHKDTSAVMQEVYSTRPVDRPIE